MAEVDGNNGDGNATPASGVKLWLRRFLGFRFWPFVTLLIVIGYIAFQIRPTHGPKSAPTSAEVSQSWGESVARLGIFPLYPPSEDFYVGDIYLQVANAPNAISAKSVRVGHVSLRKYIARPRDSLPRFDSTSEKAQGAAYRSQTDSEVAYAEAENAIQLKIVAFPDLSFTSNARNSAAAGVEAAGVSAARNKEMGSALSIPVAMTYGAPFFDAMATLKGWCNTASEKDFCDADKARQLLAYAVGSDVNSKVDGKYVYKIWITIISRVYLAREVGADTYEGNLVAAFLRAGAPDQPQPPAETGNSAAPVAVPAPPTREEAAGAIEKFESAVRTALGKATGEAPLSSGDNTSISKHQVFQRPLVFGYRAASFELVPQVVAGAPEPGSSAGAAAQPIQSSAEVQK